MIFICILVTTHEHMFISFALNLSAYLKERII
jgi:hypothetical protein